VIRTSAAEIKQSGRQTMGVRLMNLAPGDSLVAIARNAESADAAVTGDDADDGPVDDAEEGAAGTVDEESEATE
jgi:DNA gyrase subunit A